MRWHRPSQSAVKARQGMQGERGKSRERARSLLEPNLLQALLLSPVTTAVSARWPEISQRHAQLRPQERPVLVFFHSKYPVVAQVVVGS